MEPPVPDATVNPPDPPVPPPVTSPRVGRLWALVLVASTLAGVAAWLAGETALNHFMPKENMVKAMGQTVNAPTFVERIGAERKNASLANGMLGAALGLALGLVGGLARGSIRAALATAIVGALLGLGAGVGASEAILPAYFHQLDKDAEALSHDLILPLLVQCGIWGAVGAAGGASLGLGLGSGKRVVLAAMGGLIGGALGAGIYEVIGALAFPSGRTTEPIASYWAPRLLAKLSVAILAATVAAFAIQPKVATRPTKASE